MAADILIISLIASYCIFLIYKARKNAKEGKAPGCAGCGGNCGSCSGLRDECGKDRKLKDVGRNKRCTSVPERHVKERD